MRHKNFNKLDFKKIHPSGSLSIKLKTAGDLMSSGKKIPLVNENMKMKKALKVINEKKMGVVIVLKKNGQTNGIITDGDIKRIAQKYKNFEELELKKIMKKNPVSIEENTLAVKALSIMNLKKITSLCIHKKTNKKKTIGIVHMHDILKSNIN